MDLTKFKNKTNNSTLSAEEWNELIETLEIEGNLNGDSIEELCDWLSEFKQSTPIKSSPTGDVELTADGVLKLSAKKYINLDKTPGLLLSSCELTNAGKFEPKFTAFVSTIFNNFSKEIYIDDHNTVCIELDELYTDPECTTLLQVDETTNLTNTRVYEKDAEGVGIDPARDIYFMYDNKTGTVWRLTVNSLGEIEQQTAWEWPSSSIVFIEKDTHKPDWEVVVTGDTGEFMKTCALEDIIYFINWAIDNQIGPWEQAN